jgi:amidase
MKMTTIMSGWSSHGGQTLSPYVGEIEENEKLIGHSVSITTDNTERSV